MTSPASTYTATALWERGGHRFTDQRYSRTHRWRFDGGVEVPASASPHVVPPPLSSEDAVDPEEAFVAALASCHLLWFLAIAAKDGFVVDRYEDQAVGTLARDAQGRLTMTRVELRPRVDFGGDRRPTGHEVREMHERAHRQCFIANSVKSEVVVVPV
jgi:organic hydroperoxide reductase OsmC/OhrA